MPPELGDYVACVLPKWHISRRRLIPHIEEPDMGSTIQVFDHLSVLIALNDSSETGFSQFRILV